MKQRLWEEYTRAYWHGFPGTFDDYLDMTMTDRWFAMRALDDLIDQANEEGGGRPDEDRR